MSPDTPWQTYLATSGADLVSFYYDGLHRRITKDVAADGATDDIEYYYNTQWQVLEEHKGGSGAVHKKYVYHPHYVDAVAVQYSGTGTSTKHFYLHDALFNVTAIMEDDGTSGTNNSDKGIVQRYSYTPYGEVTVLKPDFSVETGTPFDNEYLYTGRRVDPETGLQLNRHRYHHQKLGRWINRDPIRYEGSKWNLYSYYDPVNSADPMGLQPAVLPDPGLLPGSDLPIFEPEPGERPKPKPKPSPTFPGWKIPKLPPILIFLFTPKECGRGSEIAYNPDAPPLFPDKCPAPDFFPPISPPPPPGEGNKDWQCWCCDITPLGALNDPTGQAVIIDNCRPEEPSECLASGGACFPPETEEGIHGKCPPPDPRFPR